MQKVIILMLCNGEKILYNNDNKGGMRTRRGMPAAGGAYA